MLLEGLLRRRHRGRHRLVPARTNVRINRRAGSGCGSIPSIHSGHRGERGRRSVRFLNHLLLENFVKNMFINWSLRVVKNEVIRFWISLKNTSSQNPWPRPPRPWGHYWTTPKINILFRVVIYNKLIFFIRDQQGKAYRYLAQYHLKKGHWDDAYNFAQKCTEFIDTKAEGKALLKEIARRKRSSSERNPISGN